MSPRLKPNRDAMLYVCTYFSVDKHAHTALHGILLPFLGILAREFHKTLAYSMQNVTTLGCSFRSKTYGLSILHVGHS